MTRVSIQRLEDEDDLVPEGHVFKRDAAHEDGGTWQAPSAGQAFPIGSVFLSVVATNPNTLLGYGTWAAFGAGRMLVGLDAADSDFDTEEETGGTKDATHGHTAGTLAPSAHTGTAVDAHSGSAVAVHPNTSFPHYHLPGFLATSAHTGTAVDAHSGTAVSNHSTHNHIYTQVVNHIHPVNVGSANDTSTVSGAGNYFAGTTSTVAPNTQNPVGGVASGTTLGPDAPLTHSVTQPNNHAVTQPNDHTFSGQTADRTATGVAVSHDVTQPNNHAVTQPSAHTMSGSTGDTYLNKMNPYIVVRMWKRTA